MTPAGRRSLGALALLLGVGAFLAGGSGPSGDAAGSEDGILAALPSEALISPLELARRIRAREPGLAVLDLRSDSAFREYHIPVARSLASGGMEDLAPDDASRLVLYGDDPASLVAARERLLGSGAGEVRILDGGAAGWIREVMNPVLPSDADSAAREAFLEAADVSRYFGGAPRIVPREELKAEGAPVSEMVESMRLRGCRGG